MLSPYVVCLTNNRPKIKVVAFLDSVGEYNPARCCYPFRATRRRVDKERLEVTDKDIVLQGIAEDWRRWYGQDLLAHTGAAMTDVTEAGA
jgi:hypothetical protein